MNSYCSEQHVRRNVHRKGKAFIYPLNRHLNSAKTYQHKRLLTSDTAACSSLGRISSFCLGVSHPKQLGTQTPSTSKVRKSSSLTVRVQPHTCKPCLGWAAVELPSPCKNEGGQVRQVRTIITSQSRWHCRVSAWMEVILGGFHHYIQGFVAASLLKRKLSLLKAWETDFLKTWKSLKSQKASSSLYTKQNMKRKVALIHSFAIKHRSKSKFSL